MSYRAIATGLAALAAGFLSADDVPLAGSARPHNAIADTTVCGAPTAVYGDVTPCGAPAHARLFGGPAEDRRGRLDLPRPDARGRPAPGHVHNHTLNLRK